MRKLIYLFGVLIILVSCNKNNEPNATGKIVISKLVLFVFICFFGLQDISAKEKIMKVNDVKYKIDITTGIASVTKNFKGKSIKGTVKGDVVILDTIVYKKKKYPVTKIESIAFLGCDKVTSITIPTTIEEIGAIVPFPGYGSFKEFKVNKDNLRFQVVDGVLYTRDFKILVAYPSGKIEHSYSVPQGVEEIYQGAFSHSKLNAISLPQSLLRIGEKAFWSCTLHSITIPYSCKFIDKEAFYSCSLKVFKYENDSLPFGKELFKDIKDLLPENIIYTPLPEMLIAKANNGDPKDQYHLAQCYEHGKGFKKNLPEAFIWYKKAADLGDAQSQYMVATMLENGAGTTSQINLATEYYVKAADNGIRAAQSCIGKWYWNGTNVKQDMTKGLDYLSKAALQNDLDACSILGNAYYNGTAILQKNENNAIIFLSKSADKYPQDAYIVGVSYFAGKGVSKNEDLALRYIEQAVENGVDEAKQLYSTLKYNSAVTSMDSKSYNTAISRFTKLLKYDSKNVLAFINRGYCYLNLSTIDYDNGEADCRQALALDPSNATAKQNLNFINQYRERVAEAERLYELGRSCFRQRDYQSAANYVFSAIELNPKDYYYITMGNAFYNCKQYDDAIGYYNMALNINPSNEEARQNIKDAKSQKKSDAIIAGLNMLNAALQNVNSVIQSSQRVNNSSTSTPTRRNSTPTPAYTSPTTPTYTDLSSCGNCNNGWDEHYKEKCTTCNGTGKIKYNNITQKWVSSDY